MKKYRNKAMEQGAKECIYDQGSGPSANKDKCFDPAGIIKTERNKVGDCNEDLSTGTGDGCIYDQVTGIISIINTVANVGDECDEDVDVGSTECMDGQVTTSGLSLSIAEDLCQNTNETINASSIYTEVNIDDECDEDLDVESNDCMVDQRAGLSSSEAENLHHNNTDTTNTKLLQQEILNEGVEKDANGLVKGPTFGDVDMVHGQLLDNHEDDDEDDHYNRFYFESDHLALKDNKQ